MVIVSMQVCHGQGVSVGRDGVKLSGFGKVDQDATVSFWADYEQKDSTIALRLHINLIQQVCDLSPEQVQKLKAASKGVVSRRVRAGSEQLLKFMVESELIPPPKEKLIVRPFKNQIVVNGAAELGKELVYLRARFKIAPADDPLWTGVLASMLTADQLKSLRDYYAKRNSQFLRTAIEIAVAELDQVVIYNGDQRQRISKQSFDDLSDQVNDSKPASVSQAQELTRPYFMNLDHLVDVLDKDQFSRLQSSRDRPTSRVSWTQR